jgi:hypothetical protein
MSMALADILLPDDERHFTWAHPTWSHLHGLEQYYPEHPTKEEQQDMRQHLKYVARTLPCKEVCRPHMLRYVKDYPPTVETKAKLSQWLHRFHNSVNHRLGKQSCEYQASLRKQDEIALLNTPRIAELVFAHLRQNHQQSTTKSTKPTKPTTRTTPSLRRGRNYDSLQRRMPANSMSQYSCPFIEFLRMGGCA